MISIYKIIDLFWPILWGIPPKHKILTLLDLDICEKEIDITLELVQKVHDSEIDRKKIVETKSLVFIASSTIVVVITLSATKSIINYHEPIDIFMTFSYLILLTTIVYFARTIWLATEALKSRSYQSISFKDVIITSDKSNNTKEKVILQIVNKTRQNYNTINEKVDNMVLAQRYFQRGIILISLYGLLIFVYHLDLFSNCLFALNIFLNLRIFFIFFCLLFLMAIFLALKMLLFVFLLMHKKKLVH